MFRDNTHRFGAIDLPNIETLGACQTDDDFTFAFWWKEPADREDASIFAAGEWEVAGVHFYHDGPNRMHLVAQRPNGSQEYDSFYDLNDDQWHHFVFLRRSATTFEWWVDGELQKTQTQTNNNFAFSGPFRLGYYGSNRYAQGAMDDFRLYSRALAQGEIEALANLP